MDNFASHKGAASEERNDGTIYIHPYKNKTMNKIYLEAGK